MRRLSRPLSPALCLTALALIYLQTDALAASRPPNITQAELATLNRFSWGIEANEAEYVSRIGIARYLDEQLAPSADDGLPPGAAAQIAAMEITQKSATQIATEAVTLQKVAQTLKGYPGYDSARRALRKKLDDLTEEAQTRALLRDLYSKNQLKEQLIWFWFNHFNVSKKKNNIGALVGDFEETAIRPHVLGKFRDLLAATLFHPAMLVYLDNFHNAAGHINENYAREIMELHTMGVGSRYTQHDVEQLARILTGAAPNFALQVPKMRPNLAQYYYAKNLFVFNPQRHDFGGKDFLGITIKKAGIHEIDEAIDILSREPATARRVSIDLAEYFCCDDPPVSLIDKMAARFRESDGDIKAVLLVMFTVPEFRASLSKKFKDPVHYVISSLRAVYGRQEIRNVKPLVVWLNRMGEPLYAHDTPDGYPMTEAAWSSPGEMERRFEIARQIGLGKPDLFATAGDPSPARHPPPPIIETPYYRFVAPTLSQTTLSAINKDAAQTNQNFLFLASPEFMHR